MSNVVPINQAGTEPTVYLTEDGFVCPSSDTYQRKRRGRVRLVRQGVATRPRKGTTAVVALPRMSIASARAAMDDPASSASAVYKLVPPVGGLALRVSSILKGLCVVLFLIAACQGIGNPVLQEARELQFGLTVRDGDWKFVQSIVRDPAVGILKTWDETPQDQELLLRLRQTHGNRPFGGDKE